MTFIDFAAMSFGLLCLLIMSRLILSSLFYDAQDFRDACKPFMTGIRLLLPAVFLLSLVAFLVRQLP